MSKSSNSPTFGIQFRILTRIADEEERSAREYAARSLETRIKRLQLMKKHIEAGGKITESQQRRLSLSEAAYIHAIEFKEDPGVKSVVSDIRQGILSGVTAVRDSLGKLIEKLEKKRR